MYDEEDDSSLSEISDLEQQQQGAPNRQKKRAGRKKPAGANDDEEYRIKNLIRAPRTCTYSAQMLYDQLKNDEIDLDAEYQRDIVWIDNKQTGLIDSMLRNFYVPPIIFVVQQANDGTQIRTCIDGKQRLTSIRRFMDGEIPHKDPYTGEKFYYTDLPKSSHKCRLLPEKYKRLFEKTQMMCVEYVDLKETDEREIFRRVQMGVALLPAEKLQVSTGPRADFVRQLLSKYLNRPKAPLSTDIEWDASRGNDFRNITTILHLVVHFTFDLKTTPSSNQIEKWLNVQDALSPHLKTKVEESFKIFERIASDEGLRNPYLRKPAKISPIEFCVIVVLISVWKEKLGLVGLAKEIGAMRDAVRKEHVDIRANSKVGKTLIDFVKGIRARVGNTATAVREEVAGVVIRRKRKRGQGREDEDEDSMDVDENETSTSPPLLPTPSTSSKEQSSSKQPPSSSSSSVVKAQHPKGKTVPASRAFKKVAVMKSESIEPTLGVPLAVGLTAEVVQGSSSFVTGPPQQVQQQQQIRPRDQPHQQAPHQPILSQAPVSMPYYAMQPQTQPQPQPGGFGSSPYLQSWSQNPYVQQQRLQQASLGQPVSQPPSQGYHKLPQRPRADRLAPLRQAKEMQQQQQHTQQPMTASQIAFSSASSFSHANVGNIGQREGVQNETPSVVPLPSSAGQEWDWRGGGNHGWRR